jgi:hypothetical protein
LIDPESIVAQGLATPAEIGAMSEIARITYDILAHAWRKKDTLLVDLKIEFGRITSGENKGMLVIGDVIDNDSWRIWPQGREDLMLDKQIYRNIEKATDEDLARVKTAYETVAEQVGSFPQMRPGMVAVICDGPELLDASNHLVQALQMFGLPTVRHVASSLKTPGYVLQLVQQLDATFARLVFVAVSGPDSALRGILDNASTNPVFPFVDSVDQVAMRCAKTLALEDTVLFGRTLLMQTNARSAIMQADAGVNAQAPPQTGLA